MFEENSLREITRLSFDCIVIEELRFQNVVLPHEIEKPAFSNSSCLKSVFEKLRFRGEFFLGLTAEIELRFQLLLPGLLSTGPKSCGKGSNGLSVTVFQ